jgi:aminopeptidase N
MPVYVPPGRGKDVKATYGNTPRMIELFEKRTGHAYPWDRYAQLTVWNFGAGGMENTSATTMFDSRSCRPRR